MKLSLLGDLSSVSAAEWRALQVGCAGATVFQSWEWLDAWWTVFGAPGAAQIHAAHDEGRLVGVMPLFRCGRGDGAVRWIGEGHADYNLALVADGHPQVARLLLDKVLHGLDDSADVHFDEIPAMSTLAGLLGDMACISGTSVLQTGLTPCPRLAVRGNEAGVVRLLKKQSLRRHRRRLEHQGRVSLRHTSDPEEICRWLPNFFDQHVRRWQATRFPSLFLDGANRSFYERLAIGLGGGGGLLFSMVCVDEVPVAYHYGLRSGEDLIWYKPAFDVRLADCAPGETLLASLVTYCAEQGLAALDFSRGDEAFKQRFATEASQNVSFLATRHWSRAAWLTLRARMRRAAPLVLRR